VWAAAENTAQHEETEVVGVDGNGAINHLARLVVIIKGLAIGVDIVIE
jgi:ribosomal protein S8E